MRSPVGEAVRIFRAGAAYFALVFGAGFVLGAIRVPFLVPRVGERIAELIETPFMFAVVVLAARHVVRRHALEPRVALRLGVGAVGLALLLLAEVGFVVLLQQRSVGAYVASKDPVAGTVFLAMLLLFALMPAALGRLDAKRGGGRPR